jgi:hypothetical protein
VGNFAISIILFQVTSFCLKPITFNKRKIDKAQIDYDIQNKLILAIIYIFNIWHWYLEGAFLIKSIYSDDKNFEYFASPCEICPK